MYVPIYSTFPLSFPSLIPTVRLCLHSYSTTLPSITAVVFLQVGDEVYDEQVRLANTSEVEMLTS